MALDRFEIVQDNKDGAVDLIAAHNPVNILIECESSAQTFPDILSVSVTGIGTYEALPLKQEGDVRTFIFQIGAMMRALLSSYNDFAQANDTIELATYLNADIALSISAIGEPTPLTLNFVAYCAAKQRGESEAMSEIYNNVADEVWGFKDREIYIHGYKNSSDLETIQLAGITKEVSLKSMYRAKITPTTVGKFNYDAEFKQITINVQPNCEDGLFVKFLDSQTGYYKHWLFNRFFKINKDYSSRGEVINNAVNLLDPMSCNIGQRVTKRIIATADHLSADQFAYMVGIITSPRVYVEINGQWILAKLSDGEQIIRESKKNTKDVVITIEFGEQNTITML